MSGSVVFVGGGHAHLYALARVDAYVRRGIHVTLIAPDHFWYSGMGPGLLSGIYRAEDDRVDVGELVKRAGGDVLVDEVTQIDAVKKELRLASGAVVAYDVVSLNVGSDIAMDQIEGAEGVALPVKPVKHFIELRRRLQEGSGKSRVVVVGGGAAGCEVAANCLALCADLKGANQQGGRDSALRSPNAIGCGNRVVCGERGGATTNSGVRRKAFVVASQPGGGERAGGQGASYVPGSDPGPDRPMELSIISSAPSLLEGQPPQAGRFMEDWFRAREVNVRLGQRVAEVVDGGVRLEDGTTVDADVVIVATGVRPSRLPGASGLAIATDGSMRVRDTLQSVDHPEIFGGGDCIELDSSPLDRVGVYAVRQGPILFHNLGAQLRSDPLKQFVPQKHYLLILNLGDGTGLLMWRGKVIHSRWAFRFKDWLDRRFIRQFQPKAH